MAEPEFRCRLYQPDFYTGAVVFLMTAFKSRRWYYRPIVKKLLAKGFKVYVYDYRTRPLLNAYPEQWVNFTFRLNEHVADNVATELRLDPEARFGIIGSSVGSALASNAVKCISELEKVVFVTLYGSSGQLVWENPTLKKIKQKFVRQNKTMQDAINELRPLEAALDAERYGQRPILLFSNMDDQTIRYSNTHRFLQSAREHNLNLTYRLVESKHHSTTIIKVLASTDLWLPFLLGLRNPELALKLEQNHALDNPLGAKAEG